MPVSVPSTTPFWMVDFSRTMAVDAPRSLCSLAVPQSMPSPSVIAYIRTTSRLRPTSAASAVLTRQTPVIAISARASSEPPLIHGASRPDNRMGAQLAPSPGLAIAARVGFTQYNPDSCLKSGEQFNAFNPPYTTANRGPKYDAQWTVVRSVGKGVSVIAYVCELSRWGQAPLFRCQIPAPYT